MKTEIYLYSATGRNNVGNSYNIFFCWKSEWLHFWLQDLPSLLVVCLYLRS